MEEKNEKGQSLGSGAAAVYGRFVLGGEGISEKGTSSTG
jgi:hypothetical protein